MNYKRYLIYLILILMAISYIGFNRINNKIENESKTEAVNTSADTSKKSKTTEQTQGNNGGINDTTTPSDESKPVKTDITLIDTLPNTIGNTSGNIVNGGFAAQQGKWMYYTSPNLRTSKPMYRSMLDGETGFKPLMSSYTIRYINVIGDWIYYYNASQGVYAIKKVKTDGTEDTKILDAYVTGMIVINDWIYYSTDGSLLGTFKIKTDGTEKKRLTNDRTMFPFSIEENTLFYSYAPSTNDYNTGLYKIDLDGSNKVKVTSDNCKNVVAQGDWIYYINFSDNSFLYKIKKDGTQRKKLLNLGLSCFNISDDVLYYVTYDDASNLYKLNFQDNKSSKLTNNDLNFLSSLSSSSTPNEPFIISSINIIDENIFCSCYYYNNEPNGFLYRVKKDGTLDKIIN